MIRIKANIDKVVILEGENLQITFNLTNEASSEITGKPYILLRVKGKEEIYIVFDSLKLQPGQTNEFKAEIKVPTSWGEGILGVYFEVEGKVISSLEYPIYVARKGDAIYVAFVWHHHQAPQFYPDGTFKDLWAYKHVLEGSFYSFKGGPYAIHMNIHERHPTFKDVDHFSPSLLEQWEYAITRGENLPGEVNTRKNEFENLLAQIRSLAQKGVIEILGSVYAHTILGFILRKAYEKGLVEEAKTLIKWEIARGLEIVERVTGIRPIGFWTPEMFWSMELVNIYSQMGIKYTVLCEQHFSRSGGDKNSIYDPYLVVDPVSSSQLIVFFRDLTLSNWISFNVDFKDEQDADQAARRFVVELAKRRENAPGGVVVIALDGENWMIMPSYRTYAPYFLSQIVKYIENSTVIKMTTLKDYLESHTPTRILTYIPYGSWINLSDRQWTGPVKDKLWEKAFTALAKVLSLYFSIGEDAWKISHDPSSELYKAMRAVSIAFDSDFYWYGEIEREARFVETWADEAMRIVDTFLSNNLKVVVVERGKSHVIIQLENHGSLPLNITLTLEARNYRNESRITLKPKTLRKIPVYTPHGDSTRLEVKIGSITIATLT
ncbi:hypothetical protein MA03_00470 [Infirmifilum uzonense]|uniref:Glycoside hydrolase family 57 N-terminal domain-containing protein n=1 Tax=Infirmifilum uzonense TaxID=1550241 RepID=A0A0F7FGV8_9CREN|nr:glycoside hydrolase family 57 protein [Infirmifilum uzonense]AKG38065.1 hypothetical protein MA03_00470 [Infirmifilum uzonense]